MAAAARIASRMAGVAQRTRLDSSFANKTVTLASLKNATARIGIALGALRAAHLRYHLSMIEMLTATQLAAYTKLRGYKGP